MESLIAQTLSELPALLLVGPRATGKTTTAARFASSQVRLDTPGESAAFRADPDAALTGLEEPVLLDEWQVVPEVLGAVKRSIDRDPRPGRYLLTGSVRAEMETETWPGTGRLVRVPMYGMTVRELQGRVGRSGPLVDRVAAAEDVDVPPEAPDLRGYLELLFRSGFPLAALADSVGARRRWLDGYAEQLLTRDALELEARRDPERLRRYVEAYALNTAGTPEEKSLYEFAGINRKTALAYERLLTNLMIVESIPAWTTNRLKRLILSSKRYLVDAALLLPAARLEVEAVLRDGDLLGRVLDTFVASQIRAELPLCTTQPRLYHLREKEGRHEVDVIAELGGERVVAVEVKADAAPNRHSARHLEWLRDRLGDRFIRGVLLHTGPRVFSLGDRVVAAPICTLWA